MSYVIVTGLTIFSISRSTIHRDRRHYDLVVT